MKPQINSATNDRIMRKNKFTCAYCGYSAKSLIEWMQLTLDHVIPQNQKIDNSDENLVTCCSSCNRITSRFIASEINSREDIIEKKRLIVQKHHESLNSRWNEIIGDL